MPVVSYGFMSEMFKPRPPTPPPSGGCVGCSANGNPSVKESAVLERVVTNRSEEWLEENEQWGLAAQVAVNTTEDVSHSRRWQVDGSEWVQTKDSLANAREQAQKALTHSTPEQLNNFKVRC